LYFCVSNFVLGSPKKKVLHIMEQPEEEVVKVQAENSNNNDGES